MSELSLTPPEPLTLEAPKAAVVETDEQAVGMVAVPSERQTALREEAQALARKIAGLNAASPEFSAEVDKFTRIGQAEMRAVSTSSSTILAKSTSSLNAAKDTAKRTGSNAQVRVAESLSDLRREVVALDPAKSDLKGAKKLLGLIPFGSKIQDYFARYESAQTQLDSIIKALASGANELAVDNKSLETEKVLLWNNMQTLAEKVVLVRALDTAISEEITNAATETQKNHLTSDALFPVRQTGLDLTTQIAVAVQGYLAMDLVRKNNMELMKGVERAQTTTVAALRTAVVVAQALSNQKLVLDQISSLNSTTNAMILSTSQMLKDQTSLIHQQASSATIDTKTLEAAFDNIYATMDAIDTFKKDAVVGMQATNMALEGQVVRSREYLERVKPE